MNLFSASALKQKRILVVGGSSGIGRQIAILSSQCNATLTIVGRNSDKLNSLRSELDGNDHNFIQSDFMHESLFESILKNTCGDKLPFDSIIASSGSEYIKPFLITKKKDFEDCSKTSLDVCMDIARHVSRKNIMKEGGSIVFISSVSTKFGCPGMGIYAASRAGIEAVSRVLAAELISKKIRVNTISAGAVMTPMHDRITKNLSKESVVKYESSHPLGFGTPMDIASMAVFLVCDMSRWITGSTFYVDGGYSSLKL